MGLDIGNRIKARRDELGISQDELAKKLGYKSRASVNKVEKGVHDIPSNKLSQYAEALQTTPAYIMGWAEDDNYFNNEKFRDHRKSEIYKNLKEHDALNAVVKLAGYRNELVNMAISPVTGDWINKQSYYKLTKGNKEVLLPREGLAKLHQGIIAAVDVVMEELAKEYADTSWIDEDPNGEAAKMLEEYKRMLIEGLI